MSSKNNMSRQEIEDPEQDQEIAPPIASDNPIDEVIYRGERHAGYNENTLIDHINYIVPRTTETNTVVNPSTEAMDTAYEELKETAEDDISDEDFDALDADKDGHIASRITNVAEASGGLDFSLFSDEENFDNLGSGSKGINQRIAAGQPGPSTVGKSDIEKLKECFSKMSLDDETEPLAIMHKEFNALMDNADIDMARKEFEARSMLKKVYEFVCSTKCKQDFLKIMQTAFDYRSRALDVEADVLSDEIVRELMKLCEQHREFHMVDDNEKLFIDIAMWVLRLFFSMKTRLTQTRDNTVFMIRELSSLREQYARLNQTVGEMSLLIKTPNVSLMEEITELKTYLNKLNAQTVMINQGLIAARDHPTPVAIRSDIGPVKLTAPPRMPPQDVEKINLRTRLLELLNKLGGAFDVPVKTLAEKCNFKPKGLVADLNLIKGRISDSTVSYQQIYLIYYAIFHDTGALTPTIMQDVARIKEMLATREEKIQQLIKFLNKQLCIHPDTKTVIVPKTTTIHTEPTTYISRKQGYVVPKASLITIRADPQ